MTTEFKELRKQVKAEAETEFKKREEQTKTEEGLNQVLLWERKTYKTNARAKLLKFLETKKNKRIQEKLNKIQEVENAKEFTGRFIITIEWKKSYMWGSNPTASTNYGFIGSSIGGCGYDKRSTATAQALNSDNRILKLLYQAKEKAIKKAKSKKNKDGSKMTTSDINRQYLGYGSGYNILPGFEGGVGVDCHKRIVEGLGLMWDSMTQAKSTDVFLIENKQEGKQ